MIYVSVQPDITYFHWQVELYLFNFLQVKIKPEDIYVVFLYNGSTPSEKGLEIQRSNPSVNFFFTQDDRPDKSYIPSIKPWGMRKLLESNLNLIREQVFYHDSDIIFREKVNESLFTDKAIQYMSASTYTGGTKELTNSECWITCSGSSACNLYLPTATIGKVFYINIIDDTYVTVFGNGNNIMVLGTSYGSQTMTSNRCVMYVYDGNYWQSIYLN